MPIITTADILADPANAAFVASGRTFTVTDGTVVIELRLHNGTWKARALPAEVYFGLPEW